MATSALIPPHIRQALQSDADETVAAAARGYGQASAGGAAVRVPRVGHRRSGSGPGRPGGTAR